MPKLSNDPSPQEVKDFYDLHTGDGSANISSEPAAILDLWHALAQALAKLERSKELVNEQAADEGLWFMAGTAPEQYLQDALRKLHATIEADEDMLAVLAQGDLASLPTQQKPTEEGTR